MLACILLLMWTTGELTLVAAQVSLRIVVIEGEDAVNIIQQKVAVAPVVEVRDRNDLPVAGVPVTFAITSQNAAFAGGLQQVTLVTNAAGRAVAAGLNPLASGTVQIGVSATYQGQTAAITIAQTNVLTAAQAANAAGAAGAGSGSGGGMSTGAIAGIAGAAAGAAAIAANLAGGDEAGPPSAPPLAVTVFPTGMGIRDITVFTLTANGGSANSPTYTWDFGDGTTGSGNPVTHVFSSEGTPRVTLRASGSNVEETAAATVTVGTMTGTWITQAGVGLTFRLVMTQQGNALTGQWFVEVAPGAPYTPSVSPLTGTLFSPRGLALLQGGECRRTLENATVNADLTAFTGAEVFGAGGPPGCGAQGSNPNQMYRRQ